MPELTSYLGETVRLLDGLHVRSFHYERIDGDAGMRERTTVHMATCDDYEKACQALGGSKTTKVLVRNGADRYEALAIDDVLIQHLCFPHLPCHGGKS